MMESSENLLLIKYKKILIKIFICNTYNLNRKCLEKIVWVKQYLYNYKKIVAKINILKKERKK